MISLKNTGGNSVDCTKAVEEIMARIEVHSRSLCPHCKTGVLYEPVSNTEGGPGWLGLLSPKQTIKFTFAQCPACQKPIITGEEMKIINEVTPRVVWDEHLFWPQSIARDPLPSTVPEHIAQDYVEATLVLPFSPKASAALSRRCLQTVLRETD